MTRDFSPLMKRVLAGVYGVYLTQFNLYIFVLLLQQQVLVTYTANVLPIKIMEFDHVPNPATMSPEFL